MITEGTYPYVVGGVSTWCHALIGGIPEVRWQVLPLVAGGQGRNPIFEVPGQARLLPPIGLWSEDPGPWRPFTRTDGEAGELPGRLVRVLLGWDGCLAGLLEALVWCRRHPHLVRGAFRHRRGWESFLSGVRELAGESAPDVAVQCDLDAGQLGSLYQTLYWVARTAAHATPPAEVLHVTAAGWAAIPALVDKALRGTRLLLTEHGVYVREAYLAAVRERGSSTARFIRTRLARSLARASYHFADVVSPVTGAHRSWEEGLGVSPERIRVIGNGVPTPRSSCPDPPPGWSFVVSVGRLDPLKDVQTMLRVAAEVIRAQPKARFFHYGPVSEGQEAYARSCYALHERLALGERFRFMGRTTDPTGVVRAADVVLLTSISEGFPMAVLEAMSEGRPVVATAVGGVSEAVQGAGVCAPPGDVHALAMNVVTLLRNPGLAQELGRHGHARVSRKFADTACLGFYRGLLQELAGTAAVTS